MSFILKVTRRYWLLQSRDINRTQWDRIEATAC